MIKLDDVAESKLNYVIENGCTNDITCEHCPMAVFDNKKESCKQIGIELKKMLDNQK